LCRHASAATKTCILSLHDALRSQTPRAPCIRVNCDPDTRAAHSPPALRRTPHRPPGVYHLPHSLLLKPPFREWHHAHSVHSQSRSEEHTSELQSRENLVCRLLLE